MPDHRVLAGLFFIITLILVTRRINLHRLMVLRQFLHRRRMFLAQLLRARRVRRIPRVWVYPRPQHWLEEMLNNRALNSLWKRHFRVSRGTFDYICGIVSPDHSTPKHTFPTGDSRTEASSDSSVETRVRKFLSIYCDNVRHWKVLCN